MYRFAGHTCHFSIMADLICKKHLFKIVQGKDDELIIKISFRNNETMTQLELFQTRYVRYELFAISFSPDVLGHAFWWLAFIQLNIHF